MENFETDSIIKYSIDIFYCSHTCFKIVLTFLCARASINYFGFCGTTATTTTTAGKEKDGVDNIDGAVVHVDVSQKEFSKICIIPYRDATNSISNE